MEKRPLVENIYLTVEQISIELLFYQGTYYYAVYNTTAAIQKANLNCSWKNKHVIQLIFANIKIPKPHIYAFIHHVCIIIAN